MKVAYKEKIIVLNELLIEEFGKNEIMQFFILEMIIIRPRSRFNIGTLYELRS